MRNWRLALSLCALVGGYGCAPRATAPEPSAPETAQDVSEELQGAADNLPGALRWLSRARKEAAAQTAVAQPESRADYKGLLEELDAARTDSIPYLRAPTLTEIEKALPQWTATSDKAADDVADALDNLRGAQEDLATLAEDAPASTRIALESIDEPLEQAADTMLDALHALGGEEDDEEDSGG
ncbi:MAG: hypothetical protein HYR64_05450 [Fimbriimonas ginsengisoli]|uniref:Uncharacterized protein n=1 Tax=Fimbriimonas ginsengisoli TaxID=1005039 RepID=A0A931LUQ6_FIMGI|nr:hypothetical protein [Fimbriimonas ginsengisoli]